MTSKFTLISWLRWSMAHSAGPGISTQALTSCPKNHPRCTLWCYHQPAVGQAHTISAWSGKPQKRKLRDLRGLSPKVCIGVTHTKLIWTQNHPETYSSRKISPQSFPHWSLIKSGYEANLQVTSSQKPNVQNGLHFPDFQWRRDGYLKIEHFNPKKFCLKTYCRYPNCDGLSSCFKKQTAREHTSFSDTTVVKRSGKQFKWNCCSTLVTEKLQSQAATVVASVSEDLQKVTRKLLRLGGNKSQICHTGWSRMICMICLTNFKNTEKTQSKV